MIKILLCAALALGSLGSLLAADALTGSWKVDVAKSTFASDNPAPKEVTLIGTKMMLAARDGLHPALAALLLDAAHEVHGGQGFFEEAGEFPGTTQVDLRVSIDADRHKRFGPSLLYRYLPFWVATMVERAIIILLPIAVILVPVFNYLP